METNRLIAILEHQAKSDGQADYKHQVASALRRAEERVKRLEDAVRTMLNTLGNCEVSSNMPAMLVYLRARADVEALIKEAK